ncbi:MAG: hypothetical protein KatS3mg088_469 [Patescibacteria group bacterium]|nr:MAG: hypothetical protein KatS3mg088_469 [Patescibacteria group bacterium]
MSVVFIKFIKFYNSFRNVFLVFFVVVIFIFFSLYIFSQDRTTGDAASHLLLAVAPIIKIGAPYKDYWDIKPPMMPLILFVWSKIFGFGIVSIRLINILLSALSVFLTYFLYKRFFKKPVFEIVFLSTLLILLSPFLHSIMLPTEILGLCMSLLALLFLIQSKNQFYKFFISGLLFFFSSQSKEPFSFTVIAVLPFFVYSFLISGINGFIKNFLLFLAGLFFGFVIIFMYLYFMGSVSSYREVFIAKSIAYPLNYSNVSKNFILGLEAAERTFTEFSSGISILIVFFLVSLFMVNKYKKLLFFDRVRLKLKFNSFYVLDKNMLVSYSALFYAIGSFLGFGLGKVFGSHYLIQVVVPFYIISGFIISSILGRTSFLIHKSKILSFISLILFLFSIVIILPKRQYLKSFLSVNFNFVMKDRVYDFEERITDITTNDQCILSVYGWGAGENYLYSGRRSCTRFFLPNIVREEWQREEYRSSILKNPPAAIIYQTNASDMDVKRFEYQVINIGNIVNNCYKRDIENNEIFVPAVLNINDLRECIKDNST